MKQQGCEEENWSHQGGYRTVHEVRVDWCRLESILPSPKTLLLHSCALHLRPNFHLKIDFFGQSPNLAAAIISREPSTYFSSWYGAACGLVFFSLGVENPTPLVWWPILSLVPWRLNWTTKTQFQLVGRWPLQDDMCVCTLAHIISATGINKSHFSSPAKPLEMLTERKARRCRKKGNFRLKNHGCRHRSSEKLPPYIIPAQRAWTKIDP